MSETENSAVLNRAKFIAGGILAVLLIGAVIVLILRSFQASALAASTTLHARKYVTTITPKTGDDGHPLTLPSTLLGVI